MKTKVLLHGDMARKFGRFWEFDVNTPAEAVKALFANCPKIKSYFTDRSMTGFQVIVDGGAPLAPTELYANHGGAVVAILPTLAGSKEQGVGQIILGVVMVVVGVVINAYSNGGASPLGNSLITSGVAMIIGGVVQMIIGVPLPNDPKEKEGNKPSYLFSGPVNTIAQGQRVPVGYGRLRVGSAVINAGIRSDDYGRGRRSWRGGGSEDGDRCVTGATKVLTKRGEMNASRVRVGDLMWAQHDETLAWGYHPVEAVEKAVAECLRVQFKDGRHIDCSLNHFFLLRDSNLGGCRWVEARDLMENDELFGTKPARVKSIHRIGVQDVLKIQVKTAKTFLTEGVTSHNVKIRNRYD